MKRIDSRSAYTFTEILVVIAIIGVLVALLLPAVQACREAARRMTCTKNLEQLILAVENYEMLHRVYPPGTVNQTGPIQTLPQGYHHNWILQLLPYLEKKNASEHVDRLVGVYQKNNMPVRQLTLNVLHCPSSHSSGPYSDYAGVHNDVEAPIDVTNNGTFFLNSRVSYFDLKDGSSSTLFIGEKETYAGDLGWMSGTRATLRNTGVPINVSHNRPRTPGVARQRIPRTSGYPLGLQVNGLPMDATLSDQETLLSLFGYADRKSISENLFQSSGSYGWGDFEELKETDAPSITLPKDLTMTVGGFGSQHPGGTQFAVGDGSVRFVSETIDPIVFLQLGHRDDGKLMDDSW